MLKSIIFLGTGMVIGCYYKSCKEKKKFNQNDFKKEVTHELESDQKNK